MKSKKTIIISICSFILIFASLLCVCGLLAQKVQETIGRLNTDMYRYEIKNFSQYKDAFDTVATDIMNLTGETIKASDEISYASVTISSGVWQISYYDPSSNPFQEVELVASEEQTSAYQMVQEAFLSNGSEYGLLCLKVLPDRVVFIAEVPYFVIYMYSGKNPEYLIVDTEDKADIHIEKLDKNWYHGTRRKLEMLYE